MAEESLAGKVAIVSGSAKGIGAATCVELATRGAIVVVNYPWPSERGDAEAVLARICQTNSSSASKCILVESDLSTTTGPQHLVDETIRQLGPRIDILINNAGVAIMKPLAESTLDQWDTMVNLNARGALLLTQAVLPYLANPSRIVSLSSVGARQGYEGSSIYNGTKSMIESFTRCWAIELGRKYGCTVNAVCPGPTDTSGFNHSTPEFLAKLQPLLNATPAGSRMGTPEEAAHAIGFLCEEKSRWITGVCLGSNGGFFMT
ncbi:short chain dehydrogenase [Hyaloscypha variabilis]